MIFHRSRYNLLILFSIFLLLGLSVPLFNFLMLDSSDGCGYPPGVSKKSIDLNFTLVHENGDEINLNELVEPYNLVYFGYSFCPDVCPVDLGRNLDSLIFENQQPYEVLPIFVTVDPDRDTPKRLEEYTSLFDDNLIGLTGSEEQIKIAKKNFMVYSSKRSSKENYLVDHSTFTYLISGEGELLRHFKRQDSANYIKKTVTCLINRKLN